jgi:hypothetical protein
MPNLVDRRRKFTVHVYSCAIPWVINAAMSGIPISQYTIGDTIKLANSCQRPAFTPVLAQRHDRQNECYEIENPPNPA